MNARAVFKEAVRRLTKEEGLTLQQIGERAGIHFTSMWRYKKGAKIGQKNAERLAPVLGVRPAELLFGNDEPTAAEKARAAKAAVEVPVADIVESPF